MFNLSESSCCRATRQRAIPPDKQHSNPGPCHQVDIRPLLHVGPDLTTHPCPGPYPGFPGSWRLQVLRAGLVLSHYRQASAASRGFTGTDRHSNLLHRRTSSASLQVGCSQEAPAALYCICQAQTWEFCSDCPGGLVLRCCNKDPAMMTLDSISPAPVSRASNAADGGSR